MFCQGISIVFLHIIISSIAYVGSDHHVHDHHRVLAKRSISDSIPGITIGMLDPHTLTNFTVPVTFGEEGYATPRSLEAI